VGGGEHTWLDVRGANGSASISPLRVFKELHGTPVDVTPTGAASREHAFTASYRSEWAYFLAAVRGEVTVEPAEDQVQLLRVLEAIYRSADEQREVKL
jgi:predicted dehydrogenase